MLFIENDKKYSTPIWSRILVLSRRYSSSAILGALRNSSLLETIATDATVELESIRLETGSRHIAFKRLLNVH